MNPNDLKGSLANTINVSNLSDVTRLFSYLHQDDVDILNTINSTTATPITVADFQALTDKNAFTTYKIMNPSGFTGAFYGQYNPVTTDMRGYYVVDNTATETPVSALVTYDYAVNWIKEVWIPEANIYAVQSSNIDGLPITVVVNPPYEFGSGPVDPLQNTANCVSVVLGWLRTLRLTPATGQIYNVRLENCRIDGFGAANPFLYTLHMEANSWLTIGNTALAYPYYVRMHDSARLELGDNTQVKWLFMYSGSKITIEDQVAVGPDSLKYVRIYDGMVIIVPGDLTYNYVEIKPNGLSTIFNTFDCLADTTPDLTVMAGYAGIITLTCTAASISITQIIGCLPTQQYIFKAAAGKTITLVNDSDNLRLVGAANMVLVGNNLDQISFTCIAGGKLVETSRAKH